MLTTAAYASTKGGIRLFHDSMSHEVANMGVKSLLISPGQLSTDMFKTVSTPSRFVGPVLPTIELAWAIVDAVDQGRTGELRLPTYAKMARITTALPQSLYEILRKLYKVDETVSPEMYLHQAGVKSKNS